MKKIFFLLIAVFFLSACTYHYGLKENWIDDDDIQFVLQHPEVKEWMKEFGEPVITEYHQDTVEFIYNYKPHLYKVEKNGYMQKVSNKDRVDLWSDRNELLSLKIVNNVVVGIKIRQEFVPVTKNENATQGPSIWLIILGILLTAGIVTFVAVD
ncbi:MAG: membrane lipoprotein lipid attachment site-containing protein [Fibrobacter sp.]|nr:membrane lipoprotein lipid attachment site-containing protein [Fibrobacter sp.]